MVCQIKYQLVGITGKESFFSTTTIIIQWSIHFISYDYYVNNCHWNWPLNPIKSWMSVEHWGPTSLIWCCKPSNKAYALCYHSWVPANHPYAYARFMALGLPHRSSKNFCWASYPPVPSQSLGQPTASHSSGCWSYCGSPKKNWCDMVWWASIHTHVQRKVDTFRKLAFNWLQLFSHHAAASLNGWRNSPKARSPINPVAHLQVGAVKQPQLVCRCFQHRKTIGPKNLHLTASENRAYWIYCFMKIDQKSPSVSMEIAKSRLHHLNHHRSFHQHLCFFHLFQGFWSDFCWQPGYSSARRTGACRPMIDL